MVEEDDSCKEPDRQENSEADSHSLQAMREAHIRRVLKMARGDLQAAAELLEISLPELRRWMKRLGIE